MSSLFLREDLGDMIDMLRWFRDFDDALRIRVAATMPGASAAVQAAELKRVRDLAVISLHTLAVELGVERYVGRGQFVAANPSDDDPDYVKTARVTVRKWLAEHDARGAS